MKLITKTSFSVLVVLLSLFAVVSSASASTITPPGTAVTATASGPDFFLSGGGLSLTCTTSTIKGTTTNPADNTISTAGTNVFFGPNPCSASLGAHAHVTVNGATPWTITAGANIGGDSWAGVVTAGNVTIIITPPIGSDCTLTIPAGVDANVTYTNSDTSIVVNDATIAYTSTGGVCGASAATGTFQGTYTVVPGLDIT